MKSYRRAAVASTFSPTHQAVLVEAMHFARIVGAPLEVLHAARQCEQLEQRFGESFSRLGGKLPIHWLPGPSPADALLDCVRAEGFDLLIAGALGREPAAEKRVFTGSVARRFLAEAPCDVLLLPYPSESPPEIQCAVFAVEPGGDISECAQGLSSVLGLRRLVLLVSENPFAAAIAASRGEAAIDCSSWAEKMAAAIESPELKVEIHVVNSNTGFGLCEAALGVGADLMVVKGFEKDGRTVLSAHLDWVRQVIPTRFLLCGRGGSAS
ncbi:MAG: hypothetical protein Fur0032_12190 [Terrimicrobiaceae bacterium]